MRLDFDENFFSIKGTNDYYCTIGKIVCSWRSIKSAYDDRDIIDVKTPLDELIQEIDKNLNEINALEEKVDVIDSRLYPYEYDHCQIGDVKSMYWTFQSILEAIKKDAIAYKKKLNK